MANVAITGAGRGIALELVKLHLAKGDRVFALLRDPDGADALRGVAAGSGGKVTLHAMDVADDASVKAGAADTGDAAIDVLYNVAGVSGSTDSELESADFADWLDVFNVNVNGPMRVFQAFLPRLGSGAKVVSFGSQVGASTWPYPGYEAYSASKAALHRLMVSVALGTKDRGIIAISVHPGWVQTDMGGPAAELTPLESAQGIAALAQRLTPEMSGGFYKWNGETHAW
ncbi:NAD(P)-dependent dehydrogenase (short-subunit alcohol dehydrogenase family) [Novosphingobium sp. PhB57]|jgi:NAD(P)-dependent dehydrogenase (short-subunit alcohol dehydrogenase family)|uniref:SDR family oxidoreductase n=1 Tax=unclassified Novosphingobium TaxID=2644732 RepID=UPI00104E46AD|nr:MULTISPECIES: SDR family oxidoreductase [unclassified Novosphingobium]TCU57370.1 NAD(P)-dependent dehydrogenase (short-subunit alcohol dehydrogenase family) [Novosphingobium sp. PhB57]TDW67305.1 NAD(P)-dependent dehydrogenase (short-subunit alcohol dehydrogenase family) [Novosphingobium sp. PhB55]